MRPLLICLFSCVFGTLAFTASAAEIVQATPAHFTLKLEAESPLSAAELWERLVRPSDWWSSDHTYSGDAGNLSLDAKAGGLWREEWSGGDVAHGRVMMMKPGEVLRLEAPFGPMQGMAVYVVWTIEITPKDAGVLVTFTVVANGTDQSRLDQLARPVERVKQAALMALVAAE